MFKEALELIKKYDRIILHRHNRPDGDAMGSQIGLKHLILENFPGKTVYMVGDEAKRFSFMEDSVMDEIPDSAYEGALAIVLDTSAKALISDDRYPLAEATLRFDHHIFCEKICDVEVTDTSFESCCGLLTCFAESCALKINALAATSLYTGMVTDSGRFRYDSTTAKTFHLASLLLEQPIDTNELYGQLYADDFAKVQLRAKFVLKMDFTAHKVAYIYTTLEEAKALNVETFTISREMVNCMANIRGVDIWVNFTETETGVLCEIRSSKFNINPVAVKYGGGGHAKASGATVADRETAMAMLQDLDTIAGGNP